MILNRSLLQKYYYGSRPKEWEKNEARTFISPAEGVRGAESAGENLDPKCGLRFRQASDRRTLPGVEEHSCPPKINSKSDETMKDQSPYYARRTHLGPGETPFLVSAVKRNPKKSPIGLEKTHYYSS